MSDASQLQDTIARLERRIAELERRPALGGAFEAVGATANTVLDTLRVERLTSGTAADGIGAGILMLVQDASGNVDEVGRIDAVLTTAAHATEAGALYLKVLGVTRTTINSAGDLIQTNDGRFGGGLYVGRTDTDPATGDVRVRVDSDTVATSPTLTLVRAKAAGGDIAENDYVGRIMFRGWHGYGYLAASIDCEIDGATSDSLMPGRLVFRTVSGATNTGRVSIESTGSVVLNFSGSALATDATGGFTYIPTCAGAPTGAPGAFTGAVAMVFDTSNDALYIYNGSWKHVHVA